MQLRQNHYPMPNLGRRVLTSLDLPAVVVEFHATHNSFTSLIGGPLFVSFYVYSISDDSHLKSLTGASLWVTSFYCQHSKLVNLIGAPIFVRATFDVADNKLTSLVGGPVYVGLSMSVMDNNLTTLEGAPQVVGGNFYCYRNPLKSLEGSPQFIGGDFCCPQTINGKYIKHESEIRDMLDKYGCRVKGRIYFKDEDDF